MARRKGGGFGGMLFFSLFWCTLTGVFVGFVVYGFARAADAKRRFVPVEGRVLSSEVDSHSDGDGTTHGFKIRYRYEAGGQVHEGDRYAFGAMRSSDGLARARRLVKEHPAGSAVTAYYDPQRPSESVIVRDPDPSLYFMILFLVPFVLVGLGMATATVLMPSRQRKRTAFQEAPARVPWEIPGWGVLEQGFDGYRVRPRTSAGGLLMAGGIGLGLTCFIGVFVVAFAGGGFGTAKPSAPLGAVGLGLAVGVLSMGRAAAGVRKKAVVSLDPAAKFVRIRSPLRTVDIPFGDIARWKVRTIMNPRHVRRDGESPMVPVVAIETTAGGDVPVHVFGAGEGERDIARKVAHAFSHWTGHAVPDVPVESGPDPAFPPRTTRDAGSAVRKGAAEGRAYRDLV